MTVFDLTFILDLLSCFCVLCYQLLAVFLVQDQVLSTFFEHKFLESVFETGTISFDLENYALCEIDCKRLRKKHSVFK